MCRAMILCACGSRRWSRVAVKRLWWSVAVNRLWCSVSVETELQSRVLVVRTVVTCGCEGRAVIVSGWREMDRNRRTKNGCEKGRHMSHRLGKRGGERGTAVEWSRAVERASERASVGVPINSGGRWQGRESSRVEGDMAEEQAAGEERERS